MLSALIELKFSARGLLTELAGANDKLFLGESSRIAIGFMVVKGIPTLVFHVNLGERMKKFVVVASSGQESRIFGPPLDSIINVPYQLVQETADREGVVIIRF